MVPPLLPLDQPLSATLFLTGGTGQAGDPYSFCVISALRDGRPSCLFNVSLVGVAGEMEPFEWYRLTAIFSEERSEDAVVGRLLSASPAAVARIVGPTRERQSRFHEGSEALSNWAMAYGITGYLRTDGTYVWYLSGEAAQTARGAGARPISATWTAAG